MESVAIQTPVKQNRKSEALSQFPAVQYTHILPLGIHVIAPTLKPWYKKQRLHQTSGK